MEATEQIAADVQEHMDYMADYCKGLEELVRLIRHDPMAFKQKQTQRCLSQYIWCKSPEQVRAVILRLGGFWRKQPIGTDMHFIRKLSEHSDLQLVIAREDVCIKRQVGTVKTKVPRKPTTPVVVEYDEVEVPVFEFDCKPVIPLQDATEQTDTIEDIPA